MSTTKLISSLRSVVLDATETLRRDGNQRRGAQALLMMGAGHLSRQTLRSTKSSPEQRP